MLPASLPPFDDGELAHLYQNCRTIHWPDHSLMPSSRINGPPIVHTCNQRNVCDRAGHLIPSGLRPRAPCPPLFPCHPNPRSHHRSASPFAAIRRRSVIAIHLPMIDTLAEPIPRCTNDHIDGNSVPHFRSSRMGQSRRLDCLSSIVCRPPSAWRKAACRTFAGLALKSASWRRLYTRTRYSVRLIQRKLESVWFCE